MKKQDEAKATRIEQPQSGMAWLKQNLWQDTSGFVSSLTTVASIGFSFAFGFELAGMALIAISTAGAAYGVSRGVELGYNLYVKVMAVLDSAQQAIDNVNQKVSAVKIEELNEVVEGVKDLEAQLKKILVNDEIQEDGIQDVQAILHDVHEAVGRLNHVAEEINGDLIADAKEAVKNIKDITDKTNDEILEDAAAVINRVSLLFGGGALGRQPVVEADEQEASVSASRRGGRSKPRGKTH